MEPKDNSTNAEKDTAQQAKKESNFSDSISSDMQKLSDQSKDSILKARDEILNEFKNLTGLAMQSQNSSVLTSEGPEAEEAWNNLYASADAIYKKMSNLQSFIFNENQVKNLISKKIQ